MTALRRTAMMVLVAIIFSSSANYVATVAQPAAAQVLSAGSTGLARFVAEHPDCWIRSWSPTPPQRGIGYPGPEEGFTISEGVRSLAQWTSGVKMSWVELTSLSNFNRFQQMREGEIRIHEFSYSCPRYALPIAAALATEASALEGLYDPYWPTEGWLRIESPGWDAPKPPVKDPVAVGACNVRGYDRVEAGARIAPAWRDDLWRVVLPTGLVAYDRYPGHVREWWPLVEFATVTRVENCDAHGVASIAFYDLLRGLRPAQDPQEVVVTNRLSLPFLARERVMDRQPPQPFSLVP